MKQYEEFTIKISREGLSEKSKEFRNQLFEIMEKLVDNKYEKGLIGENEFEITYSPNKSDERQEFTEEELMDMSR
ncbi:hypothetical protein [Clostridium beijerinckii]|uniref:hypothetical protein n=1 Tax=Clostridium beijerinckii TaxID=1520 RepID=UPI00157044ED|nr:hypothetical protein [Clostridium beijerinckii]NRU52415.1 hypothetical protein [Clostridium beijerinckii]NYC69140.1 hypothetical protein [Clostridium beijerinckii]NYC91906.1 hypothetical protein [Clostridium beijerinckii]